MRYIILRLRVERRVLHAGELITEGVAHILRQIVRRAAGAEDAADIIEELLKHRLRRKDWHHTRRPLSLRRPLRIGNGELHSVIRLLIRRRVRARLLRLPQLLLERLVPREELAPLLRRILRLLAVVGHHPLHLPKLMLGDLVLHCQLGDCVRELVVALLLVVDAAEELRDAAVLLACQHLRGGEEASGLRVRHVLVAGSNDLLLVRLAKGDELLLGRLGAVLRLTELLLRLLKPLRQYAADVLRNIRVLGVEGLAEAGLLRSDDIHRVRCLALRELQLVLERCDVAGAVLALIAGVVELALEIRNALVALILQREGLLLEVFDALAEVHNLLAAAGYFLRESRLVAA